MDYQAQDIDILINRVVVKTLGSKPTYKKLISVGSVNIVYEISLTAEDRYIFRIAEQLEDTYSPEVWAINRAKSAGVPVASLLAQGIVEINKRLFGYSLQSCIQGISLTDYIARNRIDKQSEVLIGNSVGKALAAIHSIETTGFGYIANGAGAYNAKGEWLDRLFMRNIEFQQLLGKSLDIDILFSIILAGAEIYKNSPRLLHGDYKLDHVFVDPASLEITGIIDFEEAASGDPALDIVTWDFYSGNSIKTEYILHGYQMVLTQGDHFKQRYKSMYIYKCLYMLDYYTNTKPNNDLSRKIIMHITRLANQD